MVSYINGGTKVKGNWKQDPDANIWAQEAVEKASQRRTTLYCIVLYCIVLYWRADHCCPMHCDLFKIYCDPPKIGNTRIWICRLNFAQGSIFSGLRFFNEPEISDSGPPASLPEDLCSGVSRPEKIHRPQPGLNPRILDFEASTVPQDHRGRPN